MVVGLQLAFKGKGIQEAALSGGDKIEAELRLEVIHVRYFTSVELASADVTFQLTAIEFWISKFQMWTNSFDTVAGLDKIRRIL